MKPPATTLRVGHRIEFYGPMPAYLINAIDKCLRRDYPDATCTGGDPFTNLLMTINLGPRKVRTQSEEELQ